MTIYEMIKEFVGMLTNATIKGVCLSFWIILLAEVWKWFLGVIKAFLFDLFPDLRKDKDTEGDV